MPVNTAHPFFWGGIQEVLIDYGRVTWCSRVGGMEVPVVSGSPIGGEFIRIFRVFPPRTGTANGRNPAPAWAYLTIHYDLYIRTPFSMLCVLTPCAPVQEFSHSTSLFWGQFFSYQC